MSIRFIVETISAWDKLGGHSYRVANVTATATGKRLYISSVGGDDNVKHTLARLVGLDPCEEVYSYVRDVTKAEWRRQERVHPNAPMEHEVTAAMVLALEQGGAS